MNTQMMDPTTVPIEPTDNSHEDIAEIIRDKDNIIFDLDETLFVDTKGDTAQHVFDFILRHYMSLSYPQETRREEEEVKVIVHKGFQQSKGLLAESIATIEKSLPSPENNDVVSKLLLDEEFKRLVKEDPTNKQNTEVLKELKDMGKSIIISTSSSESFAKYKIELLSMSDYVDVLLPSRIASHPNLPQKGLKRVEYMEKTFGYTSENTVYVGNSYEDDAKGQLEKGYTVVLLDTIGAYSKEGTQSDATNLYYVKSLEELVS